MRFALVPSEEELMKDASFEHSKSSNDIPDYFVRGLYEGIRSRGDEIHTIDMYEDWSTIDCCLLDWPKWSWIARLSKAGLLEKTIYCNAEPTSVLPENCPEGYRKLSKIFPYILTWNSDWVDNINVFKKNIPYRFEVQFGDEIFCEKKLLTGITANKSSNEPGELYSERKRVYEYFETAHSDEFDFYGVGWSASEHPGYGGCVDSKIDTYHKYKFAICLENTGGIKDYVTEKIYDCLCAGIIPIYGGSSNIAEYVPENCFIDYFSFDSYEQMYEYISNMTEDEYDQYRRNIQEWVENADHREQSIERYVEYIYGAMITRKECIENNKMDAFEIKLATKAIIWMRATKEEIRQKLVNMKHEYIDGK